MKASEALMLSKASSMDEIAQIEEQVKEACKEGKTSIRVSRLNEATVRWLKENGYKYNKQIAYGGWPSGYYRIEW